MARLPLSCPFLFSSQKLQQVAAVISEPSQTEKLQQSVAEIPFPSIFGFVPWDHQG